MKKPAALLLILAIAFSSCTKEEQPVPASQPDQYTLHMEALGNTFDLNAVDSLGLFSEGKKVGLTLFFEADNFKLRAYYRYDSGMEEDAAGILNDTSFTIHNQRIFMCDGPQDEPVQISIIRKYQ